MNDEGWDDEAEAMRGPDLYRCQRCRGAFFRIHVKDFIRKVITESGMEAEQEVYYCYPCIKANKPEGCHFVTYNDPGQYEYLNCDECPLPDLVCDLRNNATLKVVKKE